MAENCNAPSTIDEKFKTSQPNIDINSEKKKNKDPGVGLCRSIGLYFKEYCLNSSLHGVRYLGEENRTIAERVCWLLLFLASILMCSFLINKIYVKWDSTPVIVSFAETPTPVWQVPFPAVTICSETKVRQRIFNFTDSYHKARNLSELATLSPEELKKFADVSLVCDMHLYTQGQNTTNQSSIDFIEEVAPKFEDMLQFCVWTNGDTTNCSHFFSPSLTEEGRCFTFNMLNSSEILTEEVQNEHYLNHDHVSQWRLDTGYESGADMNVYPRRALGAGIKAGLTVLLADFKDDLDYICKGPVQGFKILLHNPEETPRVSQQYFRIPLNQEVIVAVQPDMITTAPGLRNYDASRRHCYFPNERKLSFFKIYTQQNCEVECLAMYILETCKCVAYHMPRNSTTPICGSGSSGCVSEAEKTLLLAKVKQEIDISNRKGNISTETIENCKCLPGCTSLSYNAETSQADFHWNEMFNAYQEDLSDYPGIQFARVNIFFKNTQFITSRRSELYGQTDFLASCGGLLGLCMGFSFLSLVEIVYFLTLRMWCNVKMHGKKMWNKVNIENHKNEKLRKRQQCNQSK